MTRHILVTGASIAGNTAACALARHGLEVTVVERAPAFVGGGQNIDVRGVGRDVLRRLGLDNAALAAGTGEEGTAWVDEDGQAVAEFRADAMAEEGPTAEMEILRGDLARLLFDAARDRAAYRFGDHVASLSDDGTAVSVTFASGATGRFDAVVIAEGVGSSTRDLVFPGENRSRWMDLTLAYFTVPRAPGDDALWRWHHAPGGRSVSLRPDRHGTTRAMLSVQGPHAGEAAADRAAQERFLRGTFAGVGWAAPRVLAHMAAADDFYFDVLRQVVMPRWRHGRVSLTGDAAWCATPLAGVGATLAVTGGYVLAGELAQGRDVATALSAYEAAMRPMVDAGQGVPKLAPRLMNPHSRLGIHLLHGALRLASRPAFQDLAARVFARPLPGPDLGRYG